MVSQEPDPSEPPGDDAGPPGPRFGPGPFSGPFLRASELVGRRWTGAIIYAVFHGRTRFAEIAAAVPGLSDRLLTERLRELTEHGILERDPPEGGPGRPVYRLTRKGLDLRDVLIALHRWAEVWDSDRPGAAGDNGPG